MPRSGSAKEWNSSMTTAETGVKGLVEGGLGDEGLAGPGGGADEDALLRAEPGEQGLLLDGVGGVGQLVDVLQGQFVSGSGWRGHRRFSRTGNVSGRPAEQVA